MVEVKFKYLAIVLLFVAIACTHLFLYDSHFKTYAVESVERVKVLIFTENNKTKAAMKNSTSFTRICSQRERKDFIRRTMCGGANNKKTPAVKRRVAFMVDDEHKVAYCYIPKISSSTWKMIMMTSTRSGRQLPRPLGAHAVIAIKKRHIRTTTDRNSIRNYTKFMIVRHPMDRFLSAYYDKMFRKFGRNDAHYDWLTSIRKHVLKVTGGKSLSANGSNVPVVGLKDFTKFVVNGVGQPKYLNDKHWQKFAARCDPCSVK